MSRYLLLFLLYFCLLLAACRSDDEMVIGNCSNGSFSIDLSISPTFQIATFCYLTDTDGEVVYEENITGAALGGLVFLNADNACDNRYTACVGTLFSFTNNTGAAQENFTLDEVANVPNGMGLELTSNGASTITIPFANQVQVTITNCPPVDSVQMDLPIFFAPIPMVDFFSTEYNAEDSILTITINRIFTTAQSVLVGLRQANDQNWKGLLTELTSLDGTTLDFEDLLQLQLQDIPIENVEGGEVDVYLIANESQENIIRLGYSTTNQVSVLLPENASPFLIKSKHPLQQGFYQSQRIYDQLPDILRQDELISLENARPSFSRLTAEASGGDVVKVYGFDFDPDRNFVDNRSLTFPASEGEISFNFPKISPLLEASGTELRDRHEAILNRAGPSNTVIVELTHYPAIQGDYDIFLRKVIGTPSSRDWLMGQEFERVERYF